MKTQIRKQNLMPGNVPKYIRCYDNGGESYDRFTCVFTGRYRSKTSGSFLYLGMSEDPRHPLGFGQHGESNMPIDFPSYSHLGKKVSFEDLPEYVQNCIRETYADIWGLAD